MVKHNKKKLYLSILCSYVPEFYIKIRIIEYSLKGIGKKFQKIEELKKPKYGKSVVN